MISTKKRIYLYSHNYIRLIFPALSKILFYPSRQILPTLFYWFDFVDMTGKMGEKTYSAAMFFIVYQRTNLYPTDNPNTANLSVTQF